MRVLIVGGGAREAAIAWKFRNEAVIFSASPHQNPTIVEVCRYTGGSLIEVSPIDGDAIALFAREHNINLAIVSQDACLEAGVVDCLLDGGIPTVGPRKRAAQIEWDKAYARELLYRIRPDVSPQFWTLSNEQEVVTLFSALEISETEVVVKPQGLTSGKGVKVMGKHLATYQDAANYCLEILRDKIGKSSKVIVEEKLRGVEFTLQALTDGKKVVRVPPTYDFPYRFDQDTGPGTGGMGAVTAPCGAFTFLNESDYETCMGVAQNVVDALESDDRHFTGVLNVGFFATPDGIRVMEFNARFGDPEAMNIMMLLESSISELMVDIEAGRLAPESIRFSPDASVVRYLVPPEYAIGDPRAHRFSIRGALEPNSSDPVKVFFASAIRESASGFLSLGSSRSVAVAVKSESIDSGGKTLDAWIAAHVHGPLEYRQDIGKDSYMEALRAVQKSG